MSKQEGPKVCLDACFLNYFFLNLNQLSDSKNERPYKSLVLSYFIRALVYLQKKNIPPKQSTTNQQQILKEPPQVLILDNISCQTWNLATM